MSMYNDDMMRIPRDEDELWKVILENFKMAQVILTEADVESQEEAVARDIGTADKLLEIKYRRTAKIYYDRDHFLGLGRQLVPSVEKLIYERQLSPEFVQKWGMLMYCHGFIATYITDDTDGLSQRRIARKAAGLKAVNGQRRWFSIVFLREYEALEASLDKNDFGKLKLKTVRTIVCGKILELLARNTLPTGFDRVWLERLVVGRALADAFSDDKLSFETMKKLRDLGCEGIPPTEFSPQPAEGGR